MVPLSNFNCVGLGVEHLISLEGGEGGLVGGAMGVPANGSNGTSGKYRYLKGQ
jgi:hypothetical protein